jgi:hypothetical protein
MRLFALSVATAALVAFAIPQIPRVQAQGSNTQSGANASQSTGGQSRGSDGVSTRGSNSRGASVGERSENSGRSAGVRSGRSQSSVGIRTKSSETTVGGRSQTRIGVSSGIREDIVVKRKRAHGVITFNDEPRRRVVIKKRRPEFAIETSRTTRSRLGGEVNIRTGIRSHETTGSAITINRSESSSASSSRGSRGMQSGGQARGNTGGRSGGNATGTTGQGNAR